MTGTVFLRKTAQKMGGKNAVILVSVVGMTDEELEMYKNEHQYLLQNLEMTPLKDLTEEARGIGVGSLLTMPIWRV